MQISKNQQFSKTIIKCPKCGTQQEVEQTSVIHNNTPQLKQLLEGSLNKFSCTKCHTQFYLETPLFFRDDKQRYYIYFIPLQDKTKWSEAQITMNKVIKQAFANDTNKIPPDCRLTIDRKQFIEKIAIHNNGLDDRIVEYIKYQLYNNKNEKKAIDNMRYELLYDFSAQDSEILPFVVFDREMGKPISSAHIPFDTYKELDATFGGNPKYKEEMKKIFNGFYVNVDCLLHF